MAASHANQSNPIRIMVALKIITEGLMFIGLWSQADSFFAIFFLILFALFTVVVDGSFLMILKVE